MSRESAVTLAVCQHILAQIAAAKTSIENVQLPPTLYNMVLLERGAVGVGAVLEGDPRVAGIRVWRAAP